MIKIALICVLVATFIFAVLGCFINKNNPLYLLFKIITLSCLLATGILCANLKTNFGGFTIFALLSVVPMFVTTFDFKAYLEARNDNHKQTTDLQKNLFDSDGNLLFGIVFFASSICLSLSGLYRGYPMIFGFVIGVAIGFALAFLAVSIKKSKNGFNFSAFLLAFVGVGFLIGQIVSALLFSISLQNILFSSGLFVLSAYAITRMFTKKNFVEIFHLLGMLLVFASIIF